MTIDVNKENFQWAKDEVENDLRNYPFWIISERLSGLGQPVRWDEVYAKTTGGTSSVESSVLHSEAIMRKIRIIEAVIDLIDSDAKKIIEETYFRDPGMNIEQLATSLNISGTTVCRVKKKTLEKFIAALGYQQ